MADILICGAGVAGLTTAWWLREYGFTPVVVERAPRPRPGGQPVDVRGPALTVAARMGLGEQLRAARTDMRGMSVVDEDGEELFRSTEVTLTGGPIASDDVEILRDDLTDLLLEACGGIEFRHGDRAVALDGDRVTFASGREQRFDVIIGADGQHSGMRRLAFGPDDDGRLLPLDQHVAIFTCPNTFGLDRWQVFLQRPEEMVGLLTVRGNTEVRVMMGFTDPLADYDHRDLDAQRRIVAERFAGGGWWIPALLDRAGRADDLYLTPATQVRMPSWSRGPVVLVGDAGWCTTLLSGQGTSLAVVGGYVLAGELAAAAPPAAFAAYEHRMRDFVAANQDLALTNAARVREMTTPDAAATFSPHWVASAATAIDLPDYPGRVRPGGWPGRRARCRSSSR